MVILVRSAGGISRTTQVAQGNEAQRQPFRRRCGRARRARPQIVVLPARDTTQKCSCCGAKAKPRIELSERVFRCRSCGLVLGRDRNSARNLNPDRFRASVGGTGPTVVAALVGSDGSQTKVPAGAAAAWAPESHGFSRESSQRGAPDTV